MALIVLLHTLSAVIWVGGLFFICVVLRPGMNGLLDAQRQLQLWAVVVGRFFVWVWLAVVVLSVTGVWAVAGGLGGAAPVGAPLRAMMWLGGVMNLVFLYSYFASLPRLKRSVVASNWELAARAGNQIRMSMVVNLVLGLIVICVASFGR
ncbi:MAG: hypothetical protein EPN41_01235 [Candidimonas sp.]|nr:MAG: hypothetical protein EPN41_01235 [Candidimonas sp.]